MKPRIPFLPLQLSYDHPGGHFQYSEQTWLISPPNGTSQKSISWSNVNHGFCRLILSSSSSSDPLVSHGRHFGRTVFALCNYPSLLTNGILRLEQMEDTSLEEFSAEERREHGVFEHLLDSYPGLLERLKNGSEEEILHIEELIGKGAAGARGDDMKTLKSVILDWICRKEK
ncbi:hypothetical protein EV702DRAFT_1203615 [Suillus placidus]|uniref:Uncharacterized protein n=1 Tax=Suillus placidus TaxID=48579 RepID=A0A9P7CWU6_9AGAM|nr:hypothetical protein EV702DRAFT_1203615 [Suillus placidus]